MSQFRTIDEILKERGSAPNHAELPKRPPPKILPRKVDSAPDMESLNRMLRTNPMATIEPAQASWMKGRIISWETKDKEEYGRQNRYIVLTFADHASDGDSNQIQIKYSSKMSSAFGIFLQSAMQAISYEGGFNLNTLLNQSVYMTKERYEWNDSIKGHVWKIRSIG